MSTLAAGDLHITIVRLTSVATVAAASVGATAAAAGFLFTVTGPPATSASATSVAGFSSITYVATFAIASPSFASTNP